MLNQITPVLLTYNEERNIGRTLEPLGWASEIIILDSHSTDETGAIARSNPRVRFYQRRFDTHAQQWNFALHECGIKSEWILALDADYLITDEFIGEVAGLTPNAETSGYVATFRYCVWGRPLSGTLYPPVKVLYRRNKARYIQEGHTQRVQIEGLIESLRSRIVHDDRKSLSSWLQSQDRYMRLEAEFISQAKWSELGAADKVRKFSPFAPFLTFNYCYFWKRGWMDGKYGLYYAIQRMLAESLLALRLIEQRSSSTPSSALVDVPNVHENDDL
jgi:glycosyltransferase involved in cell wall biosynthesis